MDRVIRRRVVVRGSVQGVFFRGSCQQQARVHQVNGWVANRDDGSVEAVFEGDPSGVGTLLVWMRSGPPGAVVTHLDITDEPPEGLAGFLVR